MNALTFRRFRLALQVLSVLLLIGSTATTADARVLGSSIEFTKGATPQIWVAARSADRVAKIEVVQTPPARAASHTPVRLAIPTPRHEGADVWMGSIELPNPAAAKGSRFRIDAVVLSNGSRIARGDIVGTVSEVTWRGSAIDNPVTVRRFAPKPHPAGHAREAQDSPINLRILLPFLALAAFAAPTLLARRTRRLAKTPASKESSD